MKHYSETGKGWPDGKEIQNAIVERQMPEYKPRSLNKTRLNRLIFQQKWDVIGRYFGFEPQFFEIGGSKSFNWTSAPEAMRAMMAPRVSTRSERDFTPRKKGPKTQGLSKSPKRRHKLFESQKEQCFYCARTVAFQNFNVDHLVPVSRGGKNLGNTVGSCRTCNNAKGNMTFNEFLETDYLSNERRAALGFSDLPVTVWKQEKHNTGKRITSSEILARFQYLT